MNSADDACPPSHLRDFHAALPAGHKEMHVIDGANHYFNGGGQQRAHLDTAAADAITPQLTGPVLTSHDAAIGIKSLLENGPGAKPPFTGR
jgi:dienelactone hydrolase